MSNDRTKLTELEKQTLKIAKENIGIAVGALKRGDIYHPIIEIELVSHIKNLLKEE